MRTHHNRIGFKTAILAAAAALALATAPAHAESAKDKFCQALSDGAKEIAALRDAGVPPANALKAEMHWAHAQTHAEHDFVNIVLRAFVRHIYAEPDMTPNQFALRALTNCTAMDLPSQAHTDAPTAEE